MKLKYFKNQCLAYKILYVSIGTFLLSAFCFQLLTNFINAQSGNLTIINIPTPTTQTSSNSYFKLSNMTYQLILDHIKIGNSKGNLANLNLDIENNILKTISNAEILAKMNIINTLKNSNNKQLVLSNYLQDISNTISEASFYSMLLGQQIDNSQVEMNTCIAEKKVSDQAYFQSLNFYDQPSMIQSLNQSLTYNQCISNNKVKINADSALLDKINFYNNLLQSKYKFLYDKQDTIIQNVNVLDPILLKELQIIDSTLSQYNK